MSQPDFVLIGAMKCGTSSLAAQLGAQDGIFMTSPKEPNFFSDDDVWARGTDWYRGLFAAAAPGDLKGEASTHYTKLPTHPDTIARFQTMIPAARLVYLIRNPLDRLVSHYIHEWTMGVMSTGIDEALQQHPELIDYGCYGAQLAPWIAAYGREAVLVETAPRLNAHPDEVLSRVAAHIGYRNAVSWQPLERANVSAERLRTHPLDRLLINNPVATFLRRNLVPQGLRDRIKARRQMRTRPVLSAESQALATARFTEDYTRLIELLGPDPAIDACYPFLAEGAV